MLTIPPLLADAGMRGAPLGFKWSEDIALKLFAQSDLNMRLHDAIDRSNYRAKMALGAWLLEWIAWRFEGMTDLTDVLSRAEAAWAAVIDPAYAKSLKFKLSRGIHAQPSASGALEIAAAHMGSCHARYSSGSIYLAEPVAKLATVLRHVMPDQPTFDRQLSALVERLASAAPRAGEYDRTTEVYDASAEAPISRAFFEGRVEHQSPEERGEFGTFLDGLANGGNPYVRSAEELKDTGFVGVPFRLGT